MTTDSSSGALAIGIVTADAETLREFYVDGLGFSPIDVLEFPQGAVHRLARGAAELKLYQPAEAPAPKTRTEPWQSVAGIGYAALRTDDVAADYERAVAHGAETIIEPIEHRPDARMALIRDPEHNVWELLQEARRPPREG
ncbi:MAG: VOC family protein [Acidimicrobiales bacterium]|nr:VOC family protein [Acidimicrobiales bacterium]